MIDLLQWPAMVVTVIAAWLVASSSERRRKIGFWTFLTSNVLWIVWGFHAAAWALVTLQVALAAMNIRGSRKNRLDADDGADGGPGRQSGEGDPRRAPHPAGR